MRRTPVSSGINYPSTGGAGFLPSTAHWELLVDFTELNWSLGVVEPLHVFAEMTSMEKIWESSSLPETNIAATRKPFQKETSLPTIHFQVRTVSFREGIGW